jgi:hypothetical protein
MNRRGARVAMEGRTMRAKTLRACSVALASLGLVAGCASDTWYKKGAGTDDLAQDKAACRAEGSALQGVASLEAFEKCMSARDWWHMTTPGGAPTPVKRTRKVTVKRTSPAAEPTLALAAAIAPAPTLESDVPQTPPPVDAGFVEAEEMQVEIEETVLEPESIDPKARQFWFKLGAGDDRLKSDQRRCRSDIGVATDASEPSRWGQSDAFDTCMRGRGWSGGALR